MQKLLVRVFERLSYFPVLVERRMNVEIWARAEDQLLNEAGPGRLWNMMEEPELTHLAMPPEEGIHGQPSEIGERRQLHLLGKPLARPDGIFANLLHITSSDGTGTHGAPPAE